MEEKYHEVKRVIADRQYNLTIEELEEIKELVQDIIDTKIAVEKHKNDLRRQAAKERQWENKWNTQKKP